jgi:hypothetical protein
MKKSIKKQRGLFDNKIAFIVDKNLNNLKPEDFATEKLAEANKRLRTKKLPE